MDPVFPFQFDRLNFIYNSPNEKVERRYIEMFRSLSPKDGVDVGHGWREIKRPFSGREISLRFDANEWNKRGGNLPPRVAASFSPVFWSHFISLPEQRWTAQFETQRLPVSEWRSRYEVADQLFNWLRTTPERRDETKRFIWWTDIRYRQKS